MSFAGPRAALVPGILLLVAVALAAGCRKPAPEVPPAGKELPALEVEAKGKWLYTYADEEGRFVTIDDPEKVPPSARHLVRVIDPGKNAPERSDVLAVYVLDLHELLRAGKTTARPMSREAFETGALAQLPPGAHSELPGPGQDPTSGAPAPPPPTGATDEQAMPPPAGKSSDPVVVTLYGTSWCGACKSARQYLRSRRIPFADKDIEKDPVAGRELAEKAARLGVKADRVPILDVRGRLLIGFDKARFEALLGEAS